MLWEAEISYRLCVFFQGAFDVEVFSFFLEVVTSVVHLFASADANQDLHEIFYTVDFERYKRDTFLGLELFQLQKLLGVEQKLANAGRFDGIVIVLIVGDVDVPEPGSFVSDVDVASFEVHLASFDRLDLAAGELHSSFKFLEYFVEGVGFLVFRVTGVYRLRHGRSVTALNSFLKLPFYDIMELSCRRQYLFEFYG